MQTPSLVDRLNTLLRGQNGNSFGDLTKSIDSFINIDNIKRKTRPSIEEINILIEINAVNRYMKEHNIVYKKDSLEPELDKEGKPVGLTNIILEGMAEDITDYLISLDGASRDEMIRMFQNVKEEVKSQQEASK